MSQQPDETPAETPGPLHFLKRPIGFLGRFKKLLFALMTVTGLWLMAEAAVGYVYAPEIRAWGSPAPRTKDDGTVTPMPGNVYLIYEYPPGILVEHGHRIRINR